MMCYSQNWSNHSNQSKQRKLIYVKNTTSKPELEAYSKIEESARDFVAARPTEFEAEQLMVQN